MNVSKELNEVRAARQTFSVLVRVVDELCASELTRELINMVTSFVYRLIRDGNYDFARLLRFVFISLYLNSSKLVYDNLS